MKIDSCKKIILVGGACAAGKSTFANRLSQKIEVPCYNKDTIKETFANSFGKAANIYGKLSAATFDLMYYLAEKSFITDSPIILESNFKPAENERLKILIDKYGYDCLTFVLSGDMRVLFDRYKKREDTGERHWVHISKEETFEDFALSVPIFSELSIGKVIRVDTTSFENLNYEQLFSIAKDFIQG